MTVTKTKFWIAAAVAIAAATGAAAYAHAQSERTPKGWSYEIKNGQRVPRPGNRVTNPDGSWREEVRQGNCVTVKEKTAAGEYREIRQCDPKSGG